MDVQVLLDDLEEVRGAGIVLRKLLVELFRRQGLAPNEVSALIEPILIPLLETSDHAGIGGRIMLQSFLDELVGPIPSGRLDKRKQNPSDPQS